MKTNHKLSLLQAGFAVGCGLVPALHRSLTAPTGKEMLVVGLAAALFTLAGGVGVQTVRQKMQLKPAETDKGAFVLVAGAGFLFLITAALTLLDDSMSPVLQAVSTAFAAVCGGMTLLRLKLRDQGETAAVYALVPCFHLSFFLLMFYRSNGDNPYLAQFGYEVAVVLMLLIAVYSAVAGRFEKPRPRFRAAFCGLGLTFAVQELAYAALNFRRVMALPGFGLAGLTLLAACCLMLCQGIFYPPQRAVFPQAEPAGQEQEGESEEE